MIFSFRSCTVEPGGMEGFQPAAADGAAFVRGITIENFKEKFMAARNEAPTTRP